MDGFQWGEELPFISAKCVRLRPLNEGDVPALFEIFSDPEVMRYWDSPALKSPAGAARLLQQIQQNFMARTFFQWGIEEAGEGQAIGTCTLFNVNKNHRRAEVGFALARAKWGQGLMTDALDGLIEFAFTKMGLHRLEADADPRNIKS